MSAGLCHHVREHDPRLPIVCQLTVCGEVHAAEGADLSPARISIASLAPYEPPLSRVLLMSDRGVQLLHASFPLDQPKGIAWAGVVLYRISPCSLAHALALRFTNSGLNRVKVVAAAPHSSAQVHKSVLESPNEGG